MFSKLQIASIAVIIILPLLHFLGEGYLQSVSPPVLRDQIAVVPTFLSAIGSGLFLIKGYLSYKAIETMVSKAAIVGKFYKIKIITNISLQTAVLFSDLTAFYGLAMFSIIFAYGFITNSQLDTYYLLQFYAFIIIPIVSAFSLWFENSSSASKRIK